MDRNKAGLSQVTMMYFLLIFPEKNFARTFKASLEEVIVMCS